MIIISEIRYSGIRNPETIVNLDLSEKIVSLIYKLKSVAKPPTPKLGAQGYCLNFCDEQCNIEGCVLRENTVTVYYDDQIIKHYIDDIGFKSFIDTIF